MTPEGLTKAKITKWLKVNNIWYTMVVPSTYGRASGLSDYICLHKGMFFAIEAKRADDKKGPTANQVAYMDKVVYNGGLAFLVRNQEDIDHMDKVLKERGVL
jgi:penicillin-binding protein-related factor A (putative recombinase)